MGTASDGYKAVGAVSNDGLKGNHRANVLVGNGGIDVLVGGPGNDRLYGDNESEAFGAMGDDYYIFRTASGQDIVDETYGSGTDVIRIEGMHD